MKAKKTIEKNLAVYQAKSGAITLRTDVGQQTLWATQAQIIGLFDVDQSVVSRHINNIFREGEVDQKSNMQKMHNANSDKPVNAYSLDIVLAVGYRTNSLRAIEFRKWATRVLRQHITKGYTINRSAISSHYAEFLAAVQDIRALVPSGDAIDHASVLELVQTFAGTWLSLDAYDKDRLEVKGTTKKQASITAEELTSALRELKMHLAKKGEASELFGAERQHGAVAGIVGNVMQSFGGKAMYPTVEEKAAHLLYFVIKNHPFSDGNKRSGAFAFVWFLRRTKRLDTSRMSPEALTALTLLIAESNPKDKSKVVGLVCRLLVTKKGK